VPEVSKGYSISHAYKFYKDKHFPKGENYKISKRAYRDMCCDFNKMLVEDAFEGKIVKLPFKMGRIRIKKYEIVYSKLKIDIRKTKETGTTHYLLELPEDGYLAKWAWNRLRSVSHHVVYYTFKPTWSNARRLRKFIKQKDIHKRFLT